MRPVKFKAWDKITKNLVNISAIDFETNKCRCNYVESYSLSWDTYNYQYQYTTSLENLELLQYTGIKDKNGKEIYEGDVVRLINIGGASRLRIVKRSICNPCFVLEDIHNYLYEETDFVQCDKAILEIIGNKFENPELLEEENV